VKDLARMAEACIGRPSLRYWLWVVARWMKQIETRDNTDPSQV
jgi:hypothetical protein